MEEKEVVYKGLEGLLFEDEERAKMEFCYSDNIYSLPTIEEALSKIDIMRERLLTLRELSSMYGKEVVCDGYSFGITIPLEEINTDTLLSIEVVK